MKLTRTLICAATLALCTSVFAASSSKPVKQTYQHLKQLPSVKTFSAEPSPGFCDAAHDMIIQVCAEDGGKFCTGDRSFRELLNVLGGPSEICLLVADTEKEARTCTNMFNYYLKSCPARD